MCLRRRPSAGSLLTRRAHAETWEACCVSNATCKPWLLFCLEEETIYKYIFYFIIALKVHLRSATGCDRVERCCSIGKQSVVQIVLQGLQFTLPQLRDDIFILLAFHFTTCTKARRETTILTENAWGRAARAVLSEIQLQNSEQLSKYEQTYFPSFFGSVTVVVVWFALWPDGEGCQFKSQPWSRSVCSLHALSLTLCWFSESFSFLSPSKHLHICLSLCVPALSTNVHCYPASM